MRKKGKSDSERKEIVPEILIRQTLNPQFHHFFSQQIPLQDKALKRYKERDCMEGSSLKINPCFLSLNNNVLQQSTLNPKP
jgi:hypothetical protein